MGRQVPFDRSVRMKYLAWWDWDHETLRTALPDFRMLPAEDFLDKFERLHAAV